MSLRLKFGLLLGLVGLALLIAVGCSWWTFSTLHKEVREPFLSMSSALQTLGEIKRHVEAQLAILRDPSEMPASSSAQLQDANPDSAITRFTLAGNRARASLDRLSPEEWRICAGSTALVNLSVRINGIMSLAQRSLTPEAQSTVNSRSASPHAELIVSLHELHDIIERMESKTVDDTQRALSFGDELRVRLLIVLAAALLIGLLSCVLGLVLIRRWVIMPIQGLRTATLRIAQGDLSHRIILPTAGPGNDELLQLSAEVNHMSSMVKTMQDDLVERERLAAIGEMVRRLAHNLRNPLAGIRGLAELSRSELRSIPGPASELVEHQTRIISSVDRFEKWLSELLHATRPAMLSCESVAVGPWLNGLVEVHRPLAQTLGVALNCRLSDPALQATFDARHLEHAVSAILSNALQAASAPSIHSSGRTVEVLCDPAANSKSAAAWEIAIRDSGTGIPSDLLPKIFKPYFTTKPDGNGIGLAVALQVVKAHAGEIRVESPDSRENPPCGTRFTIVLPISGPALAKDSEIEVARIGHTGGSGGQDSRH